MKIRSAYPKKIVSPEEVFAQCGSPVEFQVNKLGITSRHILAEDESPLALAQSACKKLFLEENIEKESINLLIYVTQSPEKQIPQNSSMLQQALGLSSELYSFDLSLGCSGYVHALSLAKALLLREKLQHALIVTCDCYSKHIDPKDRNTASVFGDAATATYISADTAIGLTDAGTDGQGADMLCLDNEKNLYMNGRAIFNFMMKRVPMSVKHCLQKNNLALEDVDYFAFHQANQFMLEALANHMSLPMEKICMHFAHCGNTVSSSIPIVLENLLEKKISNKTILLSGFGVGLSWATITIKI